MSEKTNTPSGRRSKKAQAEFQEPKESQDSTLKIEVSKYKSIIDAIKGKNWWRIMGSVFIAGCLLFTGIATVALAIKRLYPYSDITTNGLGATTIKSENSEVSYWLYNTAILWANSGIDVEKGNIITIRCSGKFNTAIHHLYDSAKENKEMQDEWIGPEGVQDDPMNHNGSYERRQYRIFPSLPTGALVMQVVRNNPFDTPKDDGANGDDFYFIGGERENIYINNPGTLYFSLNDIVFNTRTIRDLLSESISDAGGDRFVKAQLNNHDTTAIKALLKEYERIYTSDFNYLRKDYKTDFVRQVVKLEELRDKKNYKALEQSLKTSLKYEKEFPERIKDRIGELAYALNNEGADGKAGKRDNRINTAYENLIKELTANRAIGKMRLGVTQKKGEVISELQEYYNEGNNVYKEAWFDDNVGSFLIVVEKRSR